jgi:hypothetical protein
MSGDERGYNGWTNRETWLVNVWFNPETVDDIEAIKDQIEAVEASIGGQFGGFFSDLLGSHNINWRELAENIDAE